MVACLGGDLEQLGAICDRLAVEPGVRVACLRGAGGEAFVAGTDIEQFRTFKDGQDGVNYERRIDEGVARLEAAGFNLRPKGRLDDGRRLFRMVASFATTAAEVERFGAALAI